MSLVSMISKDKNFQKIIREHLPTKKLFKTNCDLPAFSTKYNMLVPYSLSNQYFSIIVGVAFDYMARIIVAKTIGNDNVLDQTVAGSGLHRLQNEALFPILKETYTNCILKVKEFIHLDEKDYIDVIPCACYFAKLDVFFRSGSFINGCESLLEISDNEILYDVENLCKTFYKTFIMDGLVKSDSIVVFNPKFGELSIRCAGADADIYIDGTLYDFKTSKDKGYNWDEVAQLYGYYLLDCLYKISKEQSEQTNLGILRIEKIAFYRARYGIIESLEVNKISSDGLIDTLVKMREYLYRYITSESLKNSINELEKMANDIKRNMARANNQKDNERWERSLLWNNENLATDKNLLSIISNMSDQSIHEWVSNP